MPQSDHPDLRALDAISDDPRAAAPDGAPSVQQTIVLPDNMPMVSVLGPTDELLRTMERAFPKTEILVRGNEFRLRGPADDLEVIDRLLDEIMEIVEAGHPLNKDAVERASEIYKQTLADYEQQPIDDDVRDKLRDYVARRRIELGDEPIPTPAF